MKIGKFQQILIKDPNVKCYENLRGGSRTDTAGQTDITKLLVVACERAYKLSGRTLLRCDHIILKLTF